MRTESDLWDGLLRSIRCDGGDAVTAYAIAIGIDSHGSNFDDENSTKEMRLNKMLTDKERRVILGQCVRVDLFLAAPTALPATFGCEHTYRDCMRPLDYLGLGRHPDTGRFTIATLVAHCNALPNARMQAASAVLRSGLRILRCQNMRCDRTIVHSDAWSVCGLCCLALFCGLCSKSSRQLCRVCVWNSRPDVLPLKWMEARATRLEKLLEIAHISRTSDDADVHLTCIRLLAVQAAYWLTFIVKARDCR